MNETQRLIKIFKRVKCDNMGKTKRLTINLRRLNKDQVMNTKKYQR